MIDWDITHYISPEWLKLRLTLRVLCDKKVTSEVKDKFYRVAV